MKLGPATRMCKGPVAIVGWQVHMHGTQTLEILLRCLSNIDEEVLFHACCALYCLIQRSPQARLLFLRKRGIKQISVHALGVELFRLP